MVMVEAQSGPSQLLKTGNDEIDRRIGGIPIPSLILVEGGNSTGKSVVTQQIVAGALGQGRKCHYITTENTIKSLLDQMESLGFDVRMHYIQWSLTITSLNTRSIRWSEDISHKFLDVLRRFVIYLVNAEHKDIIAIDNLSHFISVAAEHRVLEFFSNLRELVDATGSVIIITLHPYAVHRDLLIRIRSVCDGHFLLSVREMGDQVVRTLRVTKLRGASKRVDTVIGFTVDPAFGIKVIPISLARA